MVLVEDVERYMLQGEVRRHVLRERDGGGGREGGRERGREREGGRGREREREGVGERERERERERGGWWGGAEPERERRRRRRGAEREARERVRRERGREGGRERNGDRKTEWGRHPGHRSCGGGQVTVRRLLYAGWAAPLHLRGEVHTNYSRMILREILQPGRRRGVGALEARK